MPHSSATHDLHANSELVGRSAARQSIRVHYFGNPQAALRILLVGGQQGSVPLICDAINRWADWLHEGDESPQHRRTMERTAIGILAEANPARTTEVRRDHIELKTSEATAIHEAIRRFDPHLIIDIGTYVARQRHLLEHDLVLCHDIFFDIPTNSAAVEACGSRADERFLAYAVSQLAKKSILASRFMKVGRNGGVRHASPNIALGRNAWPLRFGIPCIEIVAREERTSESAAARQTKALVAAMQTTVNWAVEELQRLTEPLGTPPAGREVTVASRYAEHQTPAKMIFMRPSSGTIEQVELPGKFTPRLVDSSKVELPWAYAVSKEQVEVLELLRRQGFQELKVAPKTVDSFVDKRLVRYELNASGTALRRRPGEFQAYVDRRRFAFFPTDQPGSHLLCLLLEPHSTFGLLRQAPGIEPLAQRLESLVVSPPAQVA